jgi:alkylation response protein AidB-like acyl-CoA dehydrogenase
VDIIVFFENIDFSSLELPPAALNLREEVRAFLRAEIAAGSYTPHLGHAEFDLEFTKKVAARGWIGITWPKQYGGQERSFLERFVITEEMLAAAAPCAAHWFGDRQTGPSLLRHGSELLKQKYLPAIASGDMAFALGMSEPGSGSDLASVRTRAEKVEGGWRVTGQKVWTSWAHKADAFFVLCRTAPQTEDRHQGLSQLIIDIKTSPGVTVRPIRFMNGEHHFNEVFLDNVFVSDDHVLGEVGQGWKQITSELALERSGPERYMTTLPLLVELIRRLGESDDTRAQEMVGRLTARLWTLRRMSLAIALALDPATGRQGVDLATEAALVKDMGTFYEREIIDAARLLVAVEPTLDVMDTFERYLAESIVCAPVSTIRGGTTQVLRTLIARRLLGALK